MPIKTVSLLVVLVAALSLASAANAQETDTATTQEANDITAWKPSAPPFLSPEPQEPLSCESQYPQYPYADDPFEFVIQPVIHMTSEAAGFFDGIKSAMFGTGMGESGFYACTSGYCAIAAGVGLAMGPAGVPAFVGGCTSAAVICAFRHF